MKLGFSIVSESRRSSLRNFQTLQLVMHSRGVTGLQFLHRLSSVTKISVML